MTYGDDEVSVRVSAVTGSETVLEDTGLSWNIVRALTDSLDATQGEYARSVGGYPTVVEFRTGVELRFGGLARGSGRLPAGIAGRRGA